MNYCGSPKRIWIAFSLCLALCFVPLTASAAQDEIGELRRAIEALQAQNEALLQRIETLEAERSRETAVAPDNRGQTAEIPGGPAGAPMDATTPAADQDDNKRLEQRVRELELAKAAQEGATRSIIQDAVSTMGSNINEYVSLGGNAELKLGQAEDFHGRSRKSVQLSSAQLEFEIRANEWTLGTLIIDYDDGSDTVVTTTDNSERAIDRINLDTASLTIGNVERFPVFAKVGRMYLPFGTGTGNPVTDTLTVEDPLTLEAFETRQTAIGLGVGWPTPTPAPLSPPVYPPTVRPLLLNPLVASLGRQLGYTPIAKPPPLPAPFFPAPEPPRFTAGVFFYGRDTFDGAEQMWSPGRYFDATVGYRTRGHCGRPYDQLRAMDFCPWAVSVDLSYNSSVFESRFLRAEYGDFSTQIGTVPGAAISSRAMLGPVSLVVEWNGAIDTATFRDDLNRPISISPAAWQASLGYQFDWNPWVEEIGAQGTYLAVGYSESRDLAGVTRLVDGEAVRSGFIPRRRVLISVGEWVLEGLKVALEYSHNWDYARTEGGTGNSANGAFGTIEYVW